MHMSDWSSFGAEAFGTMPRDYGVTPTKMAAMLGLPGDTFYKPSLRNDELAFKRIQGFLQVMCEIEKSMDEFEVMEYYTSVHIPAIGMTAQEAVRLGKPELFLEYKHGLDAGAFA